MNSNKKPQLPLDLTALTYSTPMRAKPGLQVSVNLGFEVRMGAPENLGPAALFVVGVIDTSGSMYGSKLGMVQQALLNLMRTLGPEDHFALVWFNEQAGVALEPTLMTDEGKRHAQFAIDCLNATSDTYPRLGFDLVRQMFDGVEGNRALIYLGDGQSSDLGDRKWSKDQDNWQISPALTAASEIRGEGISVYTGGINLDNSTEAFLVEMAGGPASFKQIHDATDLNNMFDGVRNLAKFSAISNARLVLQTVKFAQLIKLANVARGEKVERYRVPGDINTKTISLGPIVINDKFQAFAALQVTLPDNIGDETRAFGKAVLIGDVPGLGLTNEVLASADIVQEFSRTEKPVINPRMRYILALAEAQDGFEAGSREGSDVGQVINAAKSNFTQSTSVFSNADLAAALSADEVELIRETEKDLSTLADTAATDANSARQSARSQTTTFDASTLGL